jgi:hypothetical protein
MSTCSTVLKVPLIGGQMMQLLLKCKNCGFELPAGTQMNEEAFIAINFEYTKESCNKCKGTFAYHKSDYYFK